ncbi:hypothetical protein H1R20_g15985, partial [Candolleomyces eurysporus]
MPTVHSHPIIVPDPDPSENWVITYRQALALQIVLARTKDLLVNAENGQFQGLYKIRWPLDINGNPVPPEMVYRYLNARYVTWRCFCVEEFPRTRRVRFTRKPDGSVMVYCGYLPSRCPYKLNLSKIFRHAEISPSKYEAYPACFDRQAYRDAMDRLVQIADENPSHRHHHSAQASEEQGEAVPVHNNNEGVRASASASAGGEGGQARVGREDHRNEEDDDNSDSEDDYDWGVHECCGEPMDDPKEFVVPILDGWLGFRARNPGDHSTMRDWVPGKYGWPVGETN